MSLFLILGPAAFFGFLLTTRYRADGGEHLRLFLQGLAASIAGIILQYFFRNLLSPIYGSILGVFSFWVQDFFWFSLSGALPFVLIPALRDKVGGRQDRILAFLLGSMAPAGLMGFAYSGVPRDIYFVLFLPLLRIALVILLSYSLDKALSEFGAGLALWIGISFLLGPILSLVAVFHFWSLAIVSLPLLLASLVIAYLACYGAIAPWRVMD
jgi:hypothetical protein